MRTVTVRTKCTRTRFHCMQKKNLAGKYQVVRPILQWVTSLGLSRGGVSFSVGLVNLGYFLRPDSPQSFFSGEPSWASVSTPHEQ